MSKCGVAAAALVAMASVGGCADETADIRPPAKPSEAPGAGSIGERTPIATGHSDPASCDRDETGQIACLGDRFALTECDKGAVLGSMFRENEAKGTYQYRTAFGLDRSCISELREAAPKRGLRKNDKGEFVLDRGEGYRETLIIGLQVSADGSVVEWERVQE